MMDSSRSICNAVAKSVALIFKTLKQTFFISSKSLIKSLTYAFLQNTSHIYVYIQYISKAFFPLFQVVHFIVCDDALGFPPPFTYMEHVFKGG